MGNIEEEDEEKKDELDEEYARRARECGWDEFVSGSRKKDLELGFFILPWSKASEIVYTAQFLTEIHYMKGQYDVYRNNCEHFALYCCSGLTYSPQANTIENIVDVAQKIGSFAGSILSKATSFRRNSKCKVEEESEETENHKNHPVIQNQKLDDGGDDELEKILLNDNGNHVLVMSEKKKNSPKMLKGVRVRKEKIAEFDLIGSDGDDGDDGDDMIIDEY